MIGMILAMVAGAGFIVGTEPAAGSAGASASGDDPFEVGGKAADSFESAIAERIQLAQKTFQNAKREFMQGMRNGRELFLTIRLMDNSGKVEQVFVKVDAWKGDEVQCRLASQVRRLSGYALGQKLVCSEGDLLDWTIINPDGSSEGNYIGKYVEQWAAAPHKIEADSATVQAAPVTSVASSAPVVVAK